MSATSKWTWNATAAAPLPHIHEKHTPEPPILDTVLDHIGNTPLVRINKIGREAGVECEILAKCEFFNAGGSVKDRIAKRMIEEAERAGVLKPNDGYTIIEPTSGNTGIGLALAAAVKGYRTVITLPEKMSKEKIDTLAGLGAEVIRTPTEAAWDSPESHIGVAERVCRETEKSVILDQYSNPYNPIAHYDHTAEEIISACGGRLDMIVAGAGTGGTITGIARKIKEKMPHVTTVAVDPYGSVLAVGDGKEDEVGMYQVEGIGYDFIPDALDRTVIDEWIKANDKDSFQMARRLIREEGLLCGGSSGAAMWAALQVAKRLRKDQRCVVILPDSVRNYMTKFLSDDWMREYGFLDEDASSRPESKKFGDATIRDLALPDAITINANVTCREAVSILQQGRNRLAVTSAPGNRLVGSVALDDLMRCLTAGHATGDSPVSAIMSPVRESDGFALDTPLERVAARLKKTDSVIVTQRGADGGLIAKHVVTKVDLLTYLVGE